MGLLSADLATKRLQAAHGTQEGIESISSWMLHHTESSRVLADCWLNLFRTESEERRIVLFYILNDVVQRAKKRHVDTVCSMFEQPAITAVSLARFSDKVRSVMHRCIKLIAECKAFSADGIEKMNRIITDPTYDTEDGNYEIDVIELARKIEALMQTVVSISAGFDVITRAPLDFEEQIPARMKDRKEGALLLKETKTAILKVERFKEAIASNNKRLFEFVDSLENAKRLFNMQLRDVAVVEDAYVKFGQGVREVQEEVEEMVRTGVYPAGSPPRDAPSPSAEDDVFSGGVEQVLNKIRPRDVTDEADMDLEEDEPPLPSYPPPWEKKKTQPQPSTPVRPSLVERAAALAAHMPGLASQMGIDPRARNNTAPSMSNSSLGGPPAKKPALDPSPKQEISTIAPASVAAAAAQQYVQPMTQPPPSFPAAAAVPSIPPSFPMPPPLFAPNVPPPPPSVVAQFMALQQQQQAAAAAAAAATSSNAAPLSVHTLPAAIPTTAPPPISPFSAPPPGYPPVAAAATQQYQHVQQKVGAAAAPQQQQQHQQGAYGRQQVAATQQHQSQGTHYAPLPARSHSVSGGYGNSANAGGSYQPPQGGQYPAAAQQQQQQQQYSPPVQQGYGEKKYTTMPEYGRRNSHSGLPLASPTGGGSQSGGYYPMNTQQTPGSSGSSATGAAGTPYTPTAPGYRGKKGSEGGGGTPLRGGYGGGRGGYGNGGGYGSRQEEQQSDDGYQPQYRKDSYEGKDVDYRHNQYPPRGGGGQRGFNRGNQGGYGRGFQRGGGPRGRGGGYGSQNNYGGGGGYGNQGYS